MTNTYWCDLGKHLIDSKTWRCPMPDGTFHCVPCREQKRKEEAEQALIDAERSDTEKEIRFWQKHGSVEKVQVWGRPNLKTGKRHANRKPMQ